jgi:GTP cyclohydrolase I
MSKTDHNLGLEVERYLRSVGVETPFNFSHDLHDDSKKFIIKESFERIMQALGLDMHDDSLVDTPNRLAKMYVHEIFGGLDYNNFPKCTTVENKFNYDEMVIEKNIKVLSVCEHHFSTIDMNVHIAYVPNQKVLGLSKLNRVAKFFAQRPQVQERYTEQVYYALAHILETPNIAVVAEGKHYCVIQRGIEDTHSSTITSKLGGGFKENPALRAEFMSLIRK